MLELSPALVLFVFLTFTLAGVVKGVTGMGLPTVSMGLLSLVAAPQDAASLLLLPSFATNVWQLLDGPDLFRTARRFRLMMAGVGAGTVATAGVLSGGTAAMATAGLGAMLALYAAFALSGSALPKPGRAERWLSPTVGLVTGALTGATGVFVMPAVPYLQSLGLEKEELIQALGLSFTVSTVALAAGLAATGGLDVSVLGGSALALVPSSLGVAAGTRLRRRIAPQTFRCVFLVGLLALGLYLLGA
ncbi:sulfite exporter TauE/SafE family protein [Hansschlegelia plantiphila]|uniref:Probable membrane transporter protein n=1 Tax=Hansschlegelia plantiphila TaxID=374655 RepID=A0A9W6MUW3_9HYPH|nr:sulfite exporter TauE/SafE family protein [Hansschlegelia plantiphila]GLK67241.1 membrane protein [Hansschlegelia plantiphila]